MVDKVYHIVIQLVFNLLWKIVNVVARFISLVGFCWNVFVKVFVFYLSIYNLIVKLHSTFITFLRSPRTCILVIISHIFFHCLNESWGKGDGLFLRAILKGSKSRYRLVISSKSVITVSFGSFSFVFSTLYILCSSFNSGFSFSDLVSKFTVQLLSFIKSCLCIFLCLFACSFFFNGCVLFLFSVSKTNTLQSVLCIFNGSFRISNSSLRLSHFCLFSPNSFALNSNITVCIVLCSLRRRYPLFSSWNFCFSSFYFLLCVLNRFWSCFVSNFLSIVFSLFQAFNFLFCFIRSFISSIQNLFSLVGIFLGLFSSSTKFSDFFLSRSFHFYWFWRFFFNQGWFVFSISNVKRWLSLSSTNTTCVIYIGFSYLICTYSCCKARCCYGSQSNQFFFHRFPLFIFLYLHYTTMYNFLKSFY